MKPPLLGEAGEYSRPSKVVQKSCQQTFPGPAPKEGTRKKSDVVDPDDAETKPNRKKKQIQHLESCVERQVWINSLM